MVKSKSKGSKKSKKSKKSKNTTNPEDDFYTGRATFEFPNGDIYEGEYCAHISGLIWREGLGTYTTKDGHEYTGSWYNDKMIDNTDIDIKYSKCGTFKGKLVKTKYTGEGIFEFPNNMTLKCDFFDNKPKGDITVFDVHDNPWVGVANENHSLLFQEHRYYRDINESHGKGLENISETPTEKQSVIEEEEIVEKEDFYEDIFKTSTVTEPDLDFTDSKWFQNYILFKRNLKDVLRKITNNGLESLEPEVLEWYKNYEKFKDRYCKIMDERRNPSEKQFVDKNLFQLFHSKEFFKSCQPISVIFARPKEDYLEEITEENG